MRIVLFRMLKGGLLTALILAGVGYMLATLGGVWLAGQPAFSRGSDATNDVQELTDRLTRQLPLALAVWGFAIVIFLEALLWLVRGRAATSATAEQSSGLAPGEPPLARE